MTRVWLVTTSACGHERRLRGYVGLHLVDRSAGCGQNRCTIIPHLGYTHLGTQLAALLDNLVNMTATVSYFIEFLFGDLIVKGKKRSGSGSGPRCLLSRLKEVIKFAVLVPD